jgi:hypothetical protein
MIAVLLQDTVAMVDNAGFHPMVEDDVYSLAPYLNTRLSLELLLRSIPQAIFQSSIYLLGSSRATRIYIDKETFALSISVSLVSILMQICFTLWLALESKTFLWVAFWRRLRHGSGPSLITTTVSVASEQDWNRL